MSRVVKQYVWFDKDGEFAYTLRDMEEPGYTWAKPYQVEISVPSCCFSRYEVFEQYFESLEEALAYFKANEKTVVDFFELVKQRKVDVVRGVDGNEQAE